MERLAATEESSFGDLTVPAILARYTSEQPNATAFIESRSTQTYQGVAYDVHTIGVALRKAAIGRLTHIAIMLPPSADLATAVLSVTCHAIAVPLDSKLVPAEIEQVLARLHIEALIVEDSTEARAFCQKRGFREIAALGGIGLLMCSDQREDGDLSAEADPDSIAVVLRTSGTTAEPKLVALTHRNLTARADRARRSLALTSDDRALCIAPVYYGQGLDSGLFFPLLTGGSVAFPQLPRHADPDESLMWFAEFHPTWFGTGPTTLLNMLERSRARPGVLRPRQLRFIQVGGAPMGDERRIAVEEAFGAPVLENYGSTEGGQMANNMFGSPLRGSGTFGVPDAFSIGIRDETGRLVAAGVSGEIVARGPTVTPGYYNERGTLDSVLVDGWFRTGDIGFVDVDDFLTVSGRIKDIINRGGEKISPAEIDHILSGHPDVLESAAFGVPHARLGEDVAAAVVLRHGSRVTALELRRYLKERLAPFKVPRRIHVVDDELPKGITGKISRSALARRLTAPGEPGPDGPRTTLEIEIVSLWERLLGIQSIDPMADFFQLGGDSLLAVQMLMELEIVIGHDLSESLLFEAATPRQLASAITAEAQERRALLVPLRTTGPKRPFLFFDGDLAGGGYYARRLAEFLEDRPIWLLRPFEAEDGKVPTIETMATRYLSLLREAGVSEPFLFGGHCNGALLAMETARQAESAGDRVDVVVMIEAVSVNARRSLRFAVRLFDACLRLGVHDRALRARILRRALNELWDVARSLRRSILRIRGSRGNAQSGDFDLEKSLPAVWNKDEELDRAYNLRMSAYKKAVAAFLPEPLRADLVAFKAEQTRRRFHSVSPWRGFGSTFRHTVVKGSHLGCITTEIDGLGINLREVLKQYG